jgi:hypothetical protein
MRNNLQLESELFDVLCPGVNVFQNSLVQLGRTAQLYGLSKILLQQLLVIMFNVLVHCIVIQYVLFKMRYHKPLALGEHDIGYESEGPKFPRDMSDVQFLVYFLQSFRIQVLLLS